MSHIARVGVILVVGALLLGGVYYLLSGRYAQMRSYPITVVFDDTLGLQEGAKVRMAGVEVGSVGEISLTPDNRARLRLDINKKVGIPEGSQFAIAAGTLIGEKYLEIQPTRSPRLMSRNAVVEGPAQVKKPFQIEEVGERMNRLLIDFQKISRSLNDILGEPNLRRGLAESVIGLARTTARTEQLIYTLQGIANRNQDQVDRTMNNLAVASAELRSAMADVHALTSQPELHSDVIATADSLRSATERLDAIMQDVREVTGDPAVTRNLKETTENLNEATAYARDIGERVDRLLASGKPPRITVSLPHPKFKSGTHLMLETAGSWSGHVRTDLTLAIPTDNSSGLYLGLYNFTESTKVIAQRINWLNARTAIRYGIFASSVGAGLNYDANEKLNLSADLYDPNDLQLDLRGRYYYSKHFGAVFGVDSIFRDPRAIVGIQWRN